MNILGNKVINRTENWRTARTFCDLSDQQIVRLAEKLGGEQGLRPDQVQLELFWYGVRDHSHKNGGKNASYQNNLARLYKKRFSHLRTEIESFRVGGRKLGGAKPDESYDVSDRNQDALVNNLFNTEIDVVLESPRYLFIGEAKHEETLGANGGLVLVHQLIRQYVMAQILVDLIGCNDVIKR